MFYYIDPREQRESESGLVAQFTHEWGEDASFAVFGRYSYRDGGASENPDQLDIETSVKHGGFLGMAWNRHWGRSNQQFAMSVIYGEAADYRKAQGLNNQYGTELQWKWQPRSWLTVIPNLQLTRNSDDKVETIVGLRIGVGIEQHWAESSVLDIQ